jgi:arginyl-tRNA synthetase
VLSEDAELSAARLALVRAVQLVLANGLWLLGLSAPEQM